MELEGQSMGGGAEGYEPGADSGASDMMGGYATLGICWGALTLTSRWAEPGAEIQQGLRVGSWPGEKHIFSTPSTGMEETAVRGPSSAGQMDWALRMGGFAARSSGSSRDSTL